MSPAEDVDDVGLEEDAGVGVDEVEGDGGAPPGDPLEGALQGGGPGGGEQRNDVVAGGVGHGSVVLGVVGPHLVDEVEEGSVAVRRGGLGCQPELLEEVVEVVEPGLIEALERHFFFLLFIYLFIFCMHPMEEMIEEMTQLDFIGEESVWKLWKMIYFSNLHKKRIIIIIIIYTKIASYK